MMGKIVKMRTTVHHQMTESDWEDQFISRILTTGPLRSSSPLWTHSPLVSALCRQHLIADSFMVYISLEIYNYKIHDLNFISQTLFTLYLFFALYFF